MLQGLIGHYRIIEKVASGRAGDLYKALDTRLNRPVAIKAIQERLLSDPDAVRRFKREAQAVASLNRKPYPELFHRCRQILVRYP